MIGADRTNAIGNITGQLITRQLYAEIMEILELESADRSLSNFIRFMTAMASAHDDGVIISHAGGGMTRHPDGMAPDLWYGGFSPVLFDVWNVLWEGCLCAHDRMRRLAVVKRPAHADDSVI